MPALSVNNNKLSFEQLQVKYLEWDAMRIILVKFLVNLLIPFIPTSIHEPANGTSVQKKIGLSQIQMKLSVTSLLFQDSTWDWGTFLWFFFSMLTSISVTTALQNKRSQLRNGHANLPWNVLNKSVSSILNDHQVTSEKPRASLIVGISKWFFRVVQYTDIVLSDDFLEISLQMNNWLKI